MQHRVAFLDFSGRCGFAAALSAVPAFAFIPTLRFGTANAAATIANASKASKRK